MSFLLAFLITFWGLALPLRADVPSRAAADNPDEAPIAASIEELILGEMDSQTVGDMLSNWALSMIGVPYRWGGESVLGTDCSGLVVQVYRKLGVGLPHNATRMFKQTTPISLEKISPGDLVFFGANRRPTDHVGIYVATGEVVHASSVRRQVIAEPLALIENRRLAGVRRVVE